MNLRKGASLVMLAASVAAALPSLGVARADVSRSVVHGVFFAGTVDGLYRSIDGGGTWRSATGGLPAQANIRALAVAPSNPNVVYAGVWDNGLYVSRNAGSTWQPANGGDYALATSDITGIAIDPHDPQTVYTVDGGDGVEESVDGGGTWTHIYGDVLTSVETIAANPHDSRILLADSTVWGAVKSADHGSTWTPTGNSDMGAVYGLEFNPANPNVAFAATSSGLYETIDGANTWQRTQRGIGDNVDFRSVAVDPQNGANIIAASQGGHIYRSTDGGTSWTLAASASAFFANAIAFDPGQRGHIIAGDDNGLNISSDHGATWETSYALYGHQINVLVATVRNARPTDPVPSPQNGAGARYYPATSHTLRGAFLTFYDANGGLKVFGLPLTEQFGENGQVVQYFERSRLAYANGRVSITPLGSWLTSGRHFATVGCCPPAGQMWFAATHQSLSGRFLSYWRTHKGSRLFGSPISQPLYEQNGDGTGRTYLVQYFQNARLEYHPELAGTPNVVTLGQLGRQVLKQRGWL
ncbi:MAG: hypothetical protein JWO42_3350 [Chloroflexi bacterium]|nr:hypothetical protein [Chloroflexota bacterium]